MALRLSEGLGVSLAEPLAQYMRPDFIAKFFVEAERSLIEVPNMQANVFNATLAGPVFGVTHQCTTDAFALMLRSDADRTNTGIGFWLDQRRRVLKNAYRGETDDLGLKLTYESR